MVSLDGVAPSRMVCVSASVNLPLHDKVQKFSSGTGSPGWSRKKGGKTVVVWCGGYTQMSGCTVSIKLQSRHKTHHHRQHQLNSFAIHTGWQDCLPNCTEQLTGLQWPN